MIDRVSNSMIQTYKNCRRMYELKYIHKIVPIEPEGDARARGKSFHKKVALAELKNDYFDDNIKTSVMAEETMHREAGEGIRPVEFEKRIEYKLPNGVTVEGYVDALDDVGVPIEYKTTSGSIDGAYWKALESNEQILTYLSALRQNNMTYIVCQTPSIRQKQNESDHDFAWRCRDWFQEKIFDRIQIERLYRSKLELSAFRDEQARTVDEMARCDLFYRNTNYCSHWGRMCDYLPICRMENLDAEFIGFRRYDK